VASGYDCIIIGAGHNGLVCAAYLARAGRSVLLLEAGAQVGGAAVTREFAPGYRVSAGAHFLHQFPAALIRELELERHGLRYAATALATHALSAETPALRIGRDRLEGLAPAHAGDAAAYAAFQTRLARFSAVLLPLLVAPPPQLGTASWADRLSLLSIGLRLRRLGRADMRELLRIGGMNAHDLLEDEFASPALKGALGLDAVLGTNAGPRTPGTVLTLLYRRAAESAAGRGLAIPEGGLGAFSDALARAAGASGATIRTQAPVARILVREDRAVGVVLESGEEVAAASVISNADPKTTFLSLLGAEHLDAGFVRKLTHLRSQGLAAKLHLALDRLPAFRGLEATDAGARLVHAPSLRFLEHAYNHSKYGEHSAHPALELSLPTVHEPALAPAGKHVLSVIVQYAPYALAGGWAAGRARFESAILDELESLAPGLKASVRHAQLLTPVDLEREFRMVGGHWHHAELSFDQFYFVRPVPGAAQYRTQLPGLYLCGAGSHPGGGVMGAAGANAARALLRDAA
jgi:phytoene dehydrogenase-like protein